MNKGALLIGLARAAIAEKLGGEGGMPRETDAAFLQEPGASFVTLHKQGELRGCIGSLQARRPLIEDVQGNALAAAFRDPRFPPLSPDELVEVEIEVSLLTSATPLSFKSEEDALSQLRPNIDGVILEYGSHRATFLPQVWQQLAHASMFMAHLKQKAGLPPDFWDPEIRLSIYQVEKYSEGRILA